VVFFTGRFEPPTRQFFAEVQAKGGWKGGWTRMLAALDAPDNPFAGSVWRRERGALWDVGPHALSNLTAMLGPIARLTAVGGEGDLAHLVITHESGATSTASVSLSVPPAGTNFETGVWGESGTAILPQAQTIIAVEAYQLAVQELIESAESGEPHPVDVAFGTRVVELLVSAEEQLNAAR
jgi:predicted dehydrogenase